MRKKTKLQVSLLVILLTLTVLMLSSLSALAQENINWQSNTQNKEITPPPPVESPTNWESPTFNTSSGDSSAPAEETGNMPLPIAAAVAGLLGITAIGGTTLMRKEATAALPAENGIWVREADRAAVEQMINQVASKPYYIVNSHINPARILKLKPPHIELTELGFANYASK